jgi:hypothetical protein
LSTVAPWRTLGTNRTFNADAIASAFALRPCWPRSAVAAVAASDSRLALQSWRPRFAHDSDTAFPLRPHQTLIALFSFRPDRSITKLGQADRHHPLDLRAHLAHLRAHLGSLTRGRLRYGISASDGCFCSSISTSDCRFRFGFSTGNCLLSLRCYQFAVALPVALRFLALLYNDFAKNLARNFS